MESTLRQWPRERFIAFVLFAVVLLIVNWAADVVRFPFDSGLYWALSKPALLGAFPDTIRGYLWPYLLMPIHALERWTTSDSHWAWRVISSLAYSALFTGPVAEFFRRCFGGRLSVARRSWPALLTLAIFPGLFLYPLSDLPAVLLLICALRLADSRHSTRWMLACACSGGLVAAAYNTRTIYMLAFVPMLALVPLFFFRGQPLRIRALALLAFLAGAAIVSIPQAAINKRLHGVASPLVSTSASGKSLMASQLYWGVTLQRYETSLRSDVPAASLFYTDPAGIAFNARNPDYLTDQTIPRYAQAVISHPLFFLGLYGRHLVNGIDVRDGMVYTEQMSRDKTLRSLLCLTLFSLCTFVLCMRESRDWKEWGYLTPLLLVVVCILPGAIETRFFMPLYLILFGAVATRLEWGHLRGQLRRHWPSIIVGYVVLTCVSLAITSSTMAQLHTTFP